MALIRSDIESAIATKYTHTIAYAFHVRKIEATPSSENSSSISASISEKQPMQFAISSLVLPFRWLNVLNGINCIG